MGDFSALSFLTVYFLVFAAVTIKFAFGIDILRNPQLFWLVLMQCMLRAAIVVGCLTVLARYIQTWGAPR